MPFTHEQIQGIITTHKKKSERERREWDQYRAWYTSEYWSNQQDEEYAAATGSMGGEGSLSFESNYPYAYIDTMIANVCPTNPQLTVNARKDGLDDAARFREALINHALDKQDFHKRLWELATLSSLCGRGFVKTIWNFKRETPEIYVTDPRYIFFDMGASKWDDIRYLIEVTVLTKADFESRVKKKGKKGGFYDSHVAKSADYGTYPNWLRDSTKDRSMLNDASREVFEWVTVFEFYDFSGAGRYYHILDGMDDPLFEGDLPFRFVRNPFSMLTFNDNMTNLGGLSDVKLIAPLQRRLNELDTIELWHAQSSIPVMLLQSGLVDNPEIIKSALVNNTGPGALIDMQGKANAPIRDIVGMTPMPSLSPSFGAIRDKASQMIEFVLGIPQYSRGVVGVTDVATEVALADSATRTRNGRRIKEVHDIVSAVGAAIIGLYEEFLPDDSIVPLRVGGEAMKIRRDSIQARGKTGVDNEPALYFDYEAIPYSPAENNKLVQLKNLQTFFDVLIQAPQVDKTKMLDKLLDLLSMRDIITKGGPSQEGMPGAVQPPGPQDTTAGGGLPPGLQEQQIPNPVGGQGAPTAAPSQGFQGAGAGFKGAGFPIEGL